MLQRIRIGRHERGFLHDGSDYLRYLAPGVHWIWGFGRRVETASTREATFASDQLDVYLRDPAVQEDLVVVDLREDERAIVWVRGRVTAVLGPSRERVAFWKDLQEVEVETHSARSLRLEHSALDAVLAHADGRRELLEVSVPKGSRGLLYVDEQLREELGPGRYAFWRGVAKVAVEVVDLREAALEVAGQEILTKDKVSLRLNLSASYRVVDPAKAVAATGDVRMALYRELQLALREAVGGRTLDELLAAKEEVGGEVRAAVAERAEALGTSLGGVGVRDVILPGEMKTLLNQVIEAEKRAQANLIQRREETAATRSLLNTAKLIEQSPTLLRLKELEAVERMASSIDSVQVVGGGLESLVELLLPKGE